MPPFVLLFLCIWMGRAVVLGSNDIYKDLFQNYTKELLPTWDVPTPLKLSINAALISIVSFAELEEKIITTMSFSLNWTDSRLSWNPSLYNNIYLLTLPSHTVWLPYLHISNSVNDVKPIGQEANFYAIVTSPGAVYWTPGGVFEAQCAPDVSNFPFDTQFCSFTILMWGMPAGEVEYISNSNVPDLTYYYPNSDWTLTGTQQSVIKGNYSSTFFVGLYIKRKPTYYVVTVILPTLMFCLMNPLIFCLPVESGERISLGMTILLAYAIFLTIVSASIPAKSDPLCIILLVLVLIMMISGLIVILTIVSSYYYYMEDISHANTRLRRLTSRFKQNQVENFNEEGNKKSNLNSLSGKDLSKTLDIIFCIISFVSFIGILSAYFLYVLIV
ncbi:Hypothetical predicted protein [Mytilus galloprovincialis]|uniref:Uncharacterized protein n=1 Tax=Mytilus galloprovincialis TaxID=29158 RepID=A0A8B6EEJ6_MYTGA|nr:Hypothetical predicted protein [Mytilus galloprovincialis]